MILEIVVPGDPVPKARPRFGNGHVYTPKKTVDFEGLVKLQAQSLMSLKGIKTSKNPICLSVKFFIQKPKETKFKVPISKPDIDNLLKSVMDGLNKVVYKDDGQVIRVKADKFWADEGSTEIYISELDSEQSIPL